MKAIYSGNKFTKSYVTNDSYTLTILYLYLPISNGGTLIQTFTGKLSVMITAFASGAICLPVPSNLVTSFSSCIDANQPNPGWLLVPWLTLSD